MQESLTTMRLVRESSDVAEDNESSCRLSLGNKREYTIRVIAIADRGMAIVIDDHRFI